jgi:glutathione S-transferase
MKITLYYAPNTCALAPYVTLTEAGADFEVRALNYRKRENFSPEYRKKLLAYEKEVNEGFAKTA